MTLLTIINDAQDLIGIPRSSVVITSQDDQVRQLLALANIEGKSLAKRSQWQALIKSATLTTLAAELQGTMESIAPGYNFSINQTMWNRTTMIYINGPLSPQDYQTEKTWSINGPYVEFRILDKKLYFLPATPAGQTVVFEYASTYWCQSSGGTGQARWAADTDEGVLDETLMTLGLRWRFKQAKGLDYAEDFREYETQVIDAIGRDGAKPIITLDDGPVLPYGYAIAPQGSWSV